jgi:hypothetical protein
MLVIEQYTGIVHRIIDVQLIKEPLLDVNVFNFQESGMVGIETAKTNDGNVYVFWSSQPEPTKGLHNHCQESI